jgi:hypothetical protein
VQQPAGRREPFEKESDLPREREGFTVGVIDGIAAGGQREPPRTRAYSSGTHR